MSETTDTTTDAAAETSGDSAATTEAPATETADAESTESVDYKSKFEAQQKVNRDLERKFKDAAAAKGRVAELEAEVAKLAGKEAEYADLQAKREIEQAALLAANQRIVGAELRAAAKGKVTDEALADLSLYIKPSEFEVGSDGEVDASAITAAVDDLLARKPYLAAERGKRFQGATDGGARNGAAQPSQLSRPDLARMSPPQIEEARKAGRLNDLLGIKT